MPLSAGTRLGHYDVTALLGEGGMGQVWQATDTQLNRQVALKILPDAFVADPDRLARFTREAQILASLNHPNIAAIHGIEEAEGTRALVLELVEGPTLADRIAKGPIPLDEALPIAKQIAEALEAAHEAGVIHRDLKPANVKVKDDRTVKVLDFGLAKALDPNPDADPSQSPTLTAAATQMGVILGTAAYMSPEQARGKALDRRTDIWSFGCVLFEMLTGRSAFAGETLSDTIANVLERKQHGEALPSGTPDAIRRLLRRCLDKDVRNRLQHIGDARVEIAEALWIPDTQTSEAVQVLPLQLWQRPVPALAIALMLSGIAGLGIWTATRPESVSNDLMQFVIVPPDSAPLSTGSEWPDLAISADGGLVVYVSSAAGGVGTQLNARPVDQLDGEPVPGVKNGFAPSVSPSGEWIGFLASPLNLQRVSVLGGTPETLAQTSAKIYGASWEDDDAIIFGTNGRGLFRVQPGGDQPLV